VAAVNVIMGGEPFSERIRVFVAAGDPVSRDGVASQLRGQGIELVDERRLDTAVVGVVVVDEVDEDAARDIRSLVRHGAKSVVVVATRVDDAGLLAAVEAGASGLLLRSQSTPQNLMSSIRSAAAGEGSLPPDLLGRLLGQVGRLQRHVLSPRGLTFSGLT
jgi:DNA-binding NarL/FixJ family response regulator